MLLTGTYSSRLVLRSPHFTRIKDSLKGKLSKGREGELLSPSQQDAPIATSEVLRFILYTISP